MSDLLALARKALDEDRDHMVAGLDSLAWLCAQITNWPVRVDEEKTTNDRFLRMTAAATMLSQADEIEKLREALGDIAEPLAALRRDAEAKGLRLSGMAYSIANDPEHLKRLARQALQGIEK